MTSSPLKIMACLTMLIDHMGAVLFPGEILWRIVGRIAFPIFAFLIVEGYFHTKSIKKYLLRLGLFAVFSEIPFDITLKHAKGLEFQSQNIFFTLFIALLAIALYDTLKEKRYTLAVFCVFALGVLNEFIHADYGIYGVVIIFIFYKYHENKKMLLLALLIINTVLCALNSPGIEQMTLWTIVQMFSLLSLLFIFNYNGRKGLSLRYLFYVFYPGHLLILNYISTLM